MTCKKVRDKLRKTIEKVRVAAKLIHLMKVVVDGAVRTVMLGDVGMHLVIEKTRVDLIERQISVVQRLENIYVNRMGREWYEHQFL